MSDAKQDEAGQELDFDIFSAPVPETLPRPSWRSRQKAGVKGIYKAARRRPSGGLRRLIRSSWSTAVPNQSHAFAERVCSLRFDIPPNCQGQTVEAAYACDPDGLVQRIRDRSDLTTRYYVADWPQGEDLYFDPVNVEPEGIDWEPMEAPDEDDEDGADASNIFNIVEEEDGP